MKQLGEGLFEVPSDSDASRTYIVNMTGAYPQCTCTAWAFNRNRAKRDGTLPKPCKHCTAVMRVDKSAWAGMKEKEAEAIVAAKKAAQDEENVKREKMKAELLKMRADLDGTPAPKTAKPAKVATPVSEPAPAPAKADLLAELEAMIIEQGGK